MVLAHALQTGFRGIKPFEAEVAVGQGQPEPCRRRQRQPGKQGEQLGFGLGRATEGAEAPGPVEGILVDTAGGHHGAGPPSDAVTLPRESIKNPLPKEGVEGTEADVGRPTTAITREAIRT